MLTLVGENFTSWRANPWDLLAFLAAMPTPRPDTENEISRKVFAGKGAPAYPPMLPGTRAVLEAFFAQHGEMSGGLATAALRDDLR